MKRIGFSILLSLLVIPACGKKNKSDSSSTAGEGSAAPAAANDAPTPAAPSGEKDSKTMINIPNARLYNEILVGGQPSEAQYGELAEAGYDVVIDLRPEAEAPDNEGKTTGAGLEYVRIPVGGGKGFDKDTIQAFADALGKDGKKVVHCASGNRVGALFALKAAWVDGASKEEALKAGSEAGLTGLAAKVQSLLDSE